MREGSLVLGATGTTGSLTVEKLVREKVKVSIGGRNKNKLQEYSEKYNIEAIKIDIGDKDQLRRLFEKYEVVVNCIGPFTLYGYIPLEAAIESKSNYVDSAWEQEYFKNIQSYEEVAIKNDVTIITGVGVSPGISDVMVSAESKGFDHIDRIAIYYIEGMRNRFSYGTMVSTVTALKSNAVGYSEGDYVPMKIAERGRTITLRNKFGKQYLVSYPGGDIINIPKYIKTDRIEHYLGAETMTRFIFLLGRLPLGVDSRIARIAYSMAAKFQKMVFWGNTGFSVTIEIEGSTRGKMKFSGISICNDDDPYEATAEFLANGVKYMMESSNKLKGILSPGQVFDGGPLLKRLRCYSS